MTRADVAWTAATLAVASIVNVAFLGLTPVGAVIASPFVGFALWLFVGPLAGLLSGEWRRDR